MKKAKTKKASEQLAEEAKEMEAQLDQLKKMMELEKQRRVEMSTTTDGSRWKSGNKTKQIKGYGNAVLDHHKKELERAKKRIMKHNAAGTLTNMETKILKEANKNQNKPPTSQSTSKSTEKMQETDDEFPEVDDFLQSLKLTKYKQTFIDNGFEDLETILELNEQHLETIGVPLGHKLKIMKKIKDIKDERGTSGLPQANLEPQNLSKNNMVSAETENMENDEEYSHPIEKKDYSVSGVGTETQIDDSLPDMCGSEVSSHPVTNTQSMDAQSQSYLPSSLQKSLQKSPSKPSQAISTQAQPPLSRYENSKEPGDHPSSSKPQNFDNGQDPMLGGCKIGKKES